MESYIIQLLFILSFSWYLGRVFRLRFDLPPMLGELTAGLLFGPAFLNIIHPSEYIDFLAELGIFFLMFYAGTETDPKIFFKSIKPSIIVGILGFIIPFIMGYYGTLHFFPHVTEIQALFIGVGLSITAIAVNARILMDLDLHNLPIANILIGGALVDDIISLGIFSSIVEMVDNKFSYLMLATSIGKVIAFFLISYQIGRYILPLLNKYYLEDGMGFTFSLLTALIFSVLAEFMGLHQIIGAFLAGLFVREEIKNQKLIEKLNEQLLTISYGFLGPVFFVSLAFHVSIEALFDNVWFLAFTMILAVGGKFIGSYIGCRVAKVSHGDGMIISAGMNGRGAVEMIIVSVGISMGVLTQEIVSILVSMAFLTTLLTPLAFKLLLKKYHKEIPQID